MKRRAARPVAWLPMQSERREFAMAVVPSFAGAAVGKAVPQRVAAQPVSVVQVFR